MKAHGALYNMAARDARLAAIARAIKACDPSLIMFGLPNSASSMQDGTKACAWPPKASRTRSYEQQ